MNELFPKIEPCSHLMLPVGNGHSLYVEQCGNPAGQSVLFVHGGPGGGCSTNDRRFFDPKLYHIILFDQRGCGRSLPFGSLENNTTMALVADIEAIRLKLNIKKWHLFGGSWGSTLALVYAQAFPNVVLSLVLRGVFLARTKDAHWTFAGQGANRLFPDYWQEYIEAIPKGNDGVLHRAYKVLTSTDAKAAKKLAKAWAKWEIKCCTLLPNDDFFTTATDDDKCWTLARHECHYMVNDCFLDKNQILENCHLIKDIPTIIVHGRYDVVCPLDNAWLLSKALQNAELIISEASGHASIEPNTKHHLLAATQKMLQNS